MIKKFNIKILTLLFSIIIICIYLFINSVIGNDRFNNLKSLLNTEQKEFIKKYIFPHKKISLQQQIILEQQKTISQIQQSIYEMALNLELQKKKEGSDIREYFKIIKLSNFKKI